MAPEDRGDGPGLVPVTGDGRVGAQHQAVGGQHVEVERRQQGGAEEEHADRHVVGHDPTGGGGRLSQAKGEVAAEGGSFPGGHELGNLSVHEARIEQAVGQGQVLHDEPAGEQGDAVEENHRAQQEAPLAANGPRGGYQEEVQGPPNQGSVAAFQVPVEELVGSQDQRPQSCSQGHSALVRLQARVKRGSEAVQARQLQQLIRLQTPQPAAAPPSQPSQDFLQARDAGSLAYCCLVLGHPSRLAWRRDGGQEHSFCRWMGLS